MAPAVRFGDTRLPERFWQKIRIESRGCWTWVGAVNRTGYGAFRLAAPARVTRRAHKHAYETLVGPVPAGLDLDHLCRNRACVNPAHLEAVTRRVNLLRGETVNAAHAAKTHCPQGHPYDEVNTRIRVKGWRECRICAREQKRERIHKGRDVAAWRLR